MDDIGHAVFISAIGDDAYMIFEYDNIPTLPFFYREISVVRLMAEWEK